MKKGFTLIEVVGIIVILGVVALFSVPALTKTLKESADKSYEEYEKNIKIAAESYFHGETEGIINDKYYITIGTLAEEGYLEKEINPKTNVETADTATIIITKNEDKTENYEFNEEYKIPNQYKAGLTLWYDGYTAPVNNTWEDLIGDNDASLDKYTYLYNGIKLGSLSSTVNISMPYTIEIVFKYQTDIELVNGISILSNKLLNKSVEKDTKYTLSIVYTNSKRTVYLNGKKIKSDSNVSTLDNLNFENFDGRIYAIRIYNSELSSSDISENYMADKYRFGV